MPDLNEKNYILLGGMKIEIEKFLSVNLNQSLQKISYHVLCILPDTLIGQWVREKIFFLDPYVSGSHGILDINILEQRGCNYLYLSNIPNKKIPTTEMKINRPESEPHKIKVKFTIDKKSVENILNILNKTTLSLMDDVSNDFDNGLDLDL